MTNPEQIKGIKKLGVFLILIISGYFVFFLHLDSDAIFMWDESRLAVNGAEMSLNGNYLVPTFNGEPDMWNTKPPLMVWLQAICMKLNGINELSVRLPSAIAALATFLFLFYFMLKQFRNRLIGLAAALGLLTCDGYIAIHIARTGDYDALLALLTTLYLFLFYLTVSKDQDNINVKYLFAGSVFAILAFYTKTIQGLIFIPATYLFLLLSVRFRPKAFFGLTISLAGILLVCLAYYIVRERINPGYIEASIYNDVTGRYFDQVVSPKPWNYYLKHLLNMKFSYLFYSLPFVLLYAYRLRQKAEGKFLLYLLINLIFYFAVIQVSQSKGLQYLAPAYPIMAALFGITFIAFANELFSISGVKASKPILLIVVIILFIFPYISILNKNLTRFDTNGWWSIKYGHYMHRVVTKQPGLNAISILHNGYNAHLDFYLIADQQKQLSTFKKTIADSLKPGEYILFCGSGYLKKIEEKFSYQLIDTYENCFLIRLNETTDIKTE
ncbi:MAG: glycosyltransferase family 39 protein [Bacteroidota bacterium]|nr:MAG: glycosyltransferase family 39 protein [Bacteroidota bacterium]